MKIQTFVAIAALACGTAFAQTNTGNSGSYAPNQSTAASADSTSGTSGTGLGARTRNALHRMGQKTRNVMHRVAHPRDRSAANDDQARAAGRDTQSMGAAGADATEPGRRSRMDQAYANWNAKHQ
ncbi:MAG: hypothetical protein JWQ33_387 [Ramlibacter sp.]|nr:hypothetical protein [Ramlibacter sp.]